MFNTVCFYRHVDPDRASERARRESSARRRRGDGEETARRRTEVEGESQRWQLGRGTELTS
jgi:hypothetical protein